MVTLVTGGTGFVGSWVCRRLAQAGRKVIAYDLQKGAASRYGAKEKRISFRQGDTCDFPGLTHLFRELDGHMEGIIHAAGIVGSGLMRDKPYMGVMVNVMGSVTLLELARIFNVPKFLFLSSGAVYGDAEGPLDEKNTVPNPGDLYAACKLSTELVGHQYATEYGLDFRVARIYFVYGPGRLPSQTSNRVLRAIFAPLERLADEGIERGADQALDFTYIEDAVEGIIRLYEARDLRHKVFNIGSGTAITIGKAAQIVRGLAPNAPSVPIGPGRIIPRGAPLSIDRAREELGFVPRYDFERGAKEYRDWIARTLDVT